MLPRLQELAADAGVPDDQSKRAHFEHVSCGQEAILVAHATRWMPLSDARSKRAGLGRCAVSWECSDGTGSMKRFNRK